MKCVFYSLLISTAPVDHDDRHYDTCYYRQQTLLDEHDEFLWQVYMFAFVVGRLTSTQQKLLSIADGFWHFPPVVCLRARCFILSSKTALTLSL
jgi:hypothetical protein